jgi:hypothetical protein
MSKITATRAALPLKLNDGLTITIAKAAKLLPTTSRTTLYRWSKQGIDNDAAAALLTLYAQNRVIPKVRQWQGFTIAPDGQICTPSGQMVTLSQIDQYGWVLAMWSKNLNVLAEISKTLKAIEGTRPERVRGLKLVTTGVSEPYQP